MSIEALAVMNSHRQAQLEDSPFSETFSISGSASTFKGIFDEAHVEGNKDRGNILQKKLTPMIMVPERPDGLTERTSIIRREGWTTGDKEYKFQKAGNDEEGITILWLSVEA